MKAQVPDMGDALTSRDVDLARLRIKIRAAKTEAGERIVNILPVLRDELADYKARSGAVASSDLVFATTTGRPLSKSNVRNRILQPAVIAANEALEATGQEPIDIRLTPHSLRRTFASLLFALGEDAPYVMEQMGHATPQLTRGVYARAMHRRDGEKERLRALMQGGDWALIGKLSTPPARLPTPVSTA